MNDVALGELLLRMVISLGIVLLLVFGAYLVMKRRQGGAGVPGLGRAASLVRRPARDGGPGTAGRARTGTGRNALRVLGRAGVGRASNVVAVQFAGRVLLVGANDANAPVLLADVDLDQWHAASVADDHDVHATPLPVGPAHAARPVEQSDAVAASLGLIEALREATARRG